MECICACHTLFFCFIKKTSLHESVKVCGIFNETKKAPQGSHCGRLEDCRLPRPAAGGESHA